MTDNTTPKLLVNESEASQRISKQINIGKKLLVTQPSSERKFDKLKSDIRKWIDYNQTLFNTLFDKSPLPIWHGEPVP